MKKSRDFKLECYKPKKHCYFFLMIANHKPQLPSRIIIIWSTQIIMLQTKKRALQISISYKSMKRILKQNFHRCCRYITVDISARRKRQRKRESSQRSVIAILRLIFAGYDCNLRKFNLKPLGLMLSAAMLCTEITTLVVLLLMERVIGAELEVLMKLD